jgi:hypothetical protein
VGINIWATHRLVEAASLLSPPLHSPSSRSIICGRVFYLCLLTVIICRSYGLVDRSTQAEMMCLIKPMRSNGHLFPTGESVPASLWFSTKTELMKLVTYHYCLRNMRLYPLTKCQIHVGIIHGCFPQRNVFTVIIQ